MLHKKDETDLHNSLDNNKMVALLKTISLNVFRLVFWSPGVILFLLFQLTINQHDIVYGASVLSELTTLLLPVSLVSAHIAIIFPSYHTPVCN